MSRGQEAWLAGPSRARPVFVFEALLECGHTPFIYLPFSFQFQWRGQVVSKETTWLTKPKIFTTKYWLFIRKKKKSPLPLFKETTHFLQIPPIFHRCPFPAAGCRTALASGLRQGHVLSLSSVTLTVLKSAAQVFSRMLLIRGLSHLGRGCRFLGRGPLRRDASMSLCLIRGR